MSATDMYLSHSQANWWHAARVPLPPAILALKLATWYCTCMSCSMQGSGAMVTHGTGFTRTSPVCSVQAIAPLRLQSHRNGSWSLADFQHRRNIASRPCCGPEPAAKRPLREVEYSVHA